MLRNFFALTEQGAKDMRKGIITSIFSSLSLMLPMGLFLMLIMQLLLPLMNLEANEPSLRLYVALCIGVLLIIFFTHYIQYRCTYIAAYAESAQRRIGLAEKLRTLPLAFFGRRDLSDLTTTMMSDCSDLERVFAYTIPQIFGTAISCVVICLCLIFIDWRMALAILSPFVLAISVLIGSKRLQNRMDLKKMQSKLDAADGIQEFLESIRDLRANNQEEEYLNGLNKKLDEIIHTSVRYEMTSGLMITSSQMILRLGFPITILIGTLLLIQGDLSLPLFLMFLVAASRIYDPLSGVMMQLSEIFNAMLQLQRMKDIEREPGQTGISQYTMKGYNITFNHVGFGYQDGEDVLTDISFTAKQGEVTALVGPSGGGKSTTAKLAARFWDIQTGTITVGGVDISQIDPETLLKDYAIVFQDVVLFNDTIMENIRLGRKDASDEEVFAAAKAAQCDEFVQRLPDGYQTIVGENGSTLSGGERQRISIARALLKNAPIVLLDEATASLDVENETSLQNAFSVLLKDKTVLVIAHRMRTVMGADHVVVLADGHVIEDGTPKQLMEQGGLFCRMVELQQQSSNWKIGS